MRTYFLICFCCLFLYACPTYKVNEDCELSSYEFNIPVTFEPKSEIIVFGDTISITISFPNEMISSTSGEVFIFNNVDFKPLVTLVKIDTPEVENVLYYPFTNYFEFIADSSLNLKIEGNSITYDYQQNEKDCFAQFKFIPKRKGIYYFQYGSAHQSNSNSDNRPVIYTLDSMCMTNLWIPHFLTNDSNNHKELAKESIYEYFREDVYSKWDRNDFIYGRYCFKVE